MHTSIDKFKGKAQKEFEENIAKSSIEIFKQGKNKTKYLKLLKLYKLIQFISNQNL